MNPTTPAVNLTNKPPEAPSAVVKARLAVERGSVDAIHARRSMRRILSMR